MVVIPAHGGNGLLKPPCLLQAGGFRPCPPAACLSRQAGADSQGKRYTHLQPSAPTAILRPMQSQALTFDTHAFVKRLTKAGMPEDQAEILSKGQSDLYERLVTKEYFEFTLKHELEKLRAELKHDLEKGQANLAKLRTELKYDIETLRAELKSDMDKVQANLETLRAELKHDIETVKAELKSDLEQVKAELRHDIGKVQANLEQVKAELKSDLEQVKTELKHELDQHKAANKQALKELELTLKHEHETTKTELKRDIKEMEQKLTIKLGAFLVIGVTVLSMLDKLF